MFGSEPIESAFWVEQSAGPELDTFGRKEFILAGNRFAAASTGEPAECHVGGYYTMARHFGGEGVPA
jgi:hypothetical protein